MVLWVRFIWKISKNMTYILFDFNSIVVQKLLKFSHFYRRLDCKTYYIAGYCNNSKSISRRRAGLDTSPRPSFENIS